MRRPGRPLLGAAPLDERLTVLVTTPMLVALKARSGGHVPEYVRRVLQASLHGGLKKWARVRKTGRGRRRILRYTE